MMAFKFDDKNVTPKVDFSRVIDTSKLQGLNVLITGGANGIGAAITRKLAAEGAYVTIADLSEDAGKTLEEELQAQGQCVKFVQTDVADWSSMVNAFKTAICHGEVRRLDLVLANAGTPGIPLPMHKNISLEEDPPKPSTATIDVTLTGVYFTACLAVHYFRLPLPSRSLPRALRKQHLLFTCSLAGYLEVPPIADYNASKFGVRGLWKSIRDELAGLDIRSNMIAPTFLPTAAINQVSAKLEEQGAKIGRVEDVVEAVVRLACDDSIDRRAIGVGGYGNFDLRDDYEGLDGGIETLEYFRTGAMSEGMYKFKDILAGRTWD